MKPTMAPAIKDALMTAGVMIGCAVITAGFLIATVWVYGWFWHWMMGY